VKQFQKVLNEFEFISLDLIVFEKKRKTSPSYLSARSGPPGQHLFSAAARVRFSLFFFPQPLTPGSHLSAPPSPSSLFLSLLRPVARRRISGCARSAFPHPPFHL
jgi:hypothetical protein